MTDEQIVNAAKSAEKKTEFGELVHSKVSRGVNSAYGIGFLEGAEWAREQLESEKPMEGLDEEIDRLWESFADEMEGPHNLFDIYARLARHFAEWGAERQKEQMRKEAVEADVNTYRDLAAGKSWAEFVVEKPPKNLGDKVRIIIVKEDEK